MRKLIIVVCLMIITSAFEPKAKAVQAKPDINPVETAQVLDTLATKIHYLNQIKSRNETR